MNTFCQFGSNDKDYLLAVMEDGSVQFGRGVCVSGIYPDKLRLTSPYVDASLVISRDTGTISAPEFGTVKLYEAVVDLLGPGAVITFYGA